ncbi:MAG: fibronectin type III domain-containing protein, partial [Actinobacteria bacterium]|nr:fibronectin type III domain-containing protein [Actinomycetota bacterium]
YGTWNHVPYRNQDGVVPATHSGCIPTVPATAQRPAWTKTARGNNSVKLTWAAPSRRINRVTVSIEPYRPSMGSYGRPYYRRFNAKDRTATVGNLDGGRTYRFRVSFHNSQGNSAWGDRTVATPY